MNNPNEKDVVNMDESSNDNKEEWIDSFKSLDNLLDKKFPPIQWLVDGLIPEGSIVLMSAKPASYKTWLAYQMALSVSTGEKFLNQFKTEQSAVLIVDGEAGERQLHNRLLTLGALKGLPIYYQVWSGGKKIDKTYKSQLLAFCAINKIKFIIFDSLVRFLNVKDENSAIEVADAFKRISSFKTAGITTLFIAHNRKGNSSYEGGNIDSVRGSSDIVASCDIHLSINRGTNNIIVVSQPKNRLDEEITPFRAKLVKESSNSSVWQFVDNVKSVDRGDIMKESIVDMLSDNECLNQKQIKEALLGSGIDVGEKKVRAILNEMKANGLLSSQRGERTEILYSLRRGGQNG